jgi:enterochelin esterase family protein
MQRSAFGFPFASVLFLLGCGSSASSRNPTSEAVGGGKAPAEAGNSGGASTATDGGSPAGNGVAAAPPGSSGDDASSGGPRPVAGGQGLPGGSTDAANSEAGSARAIDAMAGLPSPAGDGGATDLGTLGDGDFTISPPFMAGRVAVTNVPHSTAYAFTMTSTVVYPANGPRVVTVYIPEQYVDGMAAPFIVVQDGNAPATGLPEIVTAGESLYGDPSPTNRIPPLVWVFVPPGSDRSGEYDTVSDAYSRFINSEVLPLVESNAAIKAAYPNFKLTTDPDGRAAYGCSSGAPAAMGMAWFADYHRVVSYSGSFVALQTSTAHPGGAWEYPSMILATPAKPLRIFLEVGEDDNGYTVAAASQMNWVIANQNMAAALKMQGYPYRFLFAKTATHCDGAVKSQTYEETLSWLWRGYPN